MEENVYVRYQMPRLSFCNKENEPRNSHVDSLLGLKPVQVLEKIK